MISHSHQLKTISMHIYSGQATSRRSQGGRFLHYSNPVTTELKCFHYSFKPPGESRYDKLGSAYYVLNQDWLQENSSKTELVYFYLLPFFCLSWFVFWMLLNLNSLQDHWAHLAGDLESRNTSNNYKYITYFWKVLWKPQMSWASFNLPLGPSAQLKYFETV